MADTTATITQTLARCYLLICGLNEGDDAAAPSTTSRANPRRNNNNKKRAGTRARANHNSAPARRTPDRTAIVAFLQGLDGSQLHAVLELLNEQARSSANNSDVYDRALLYGFSRLVSLSIESSTAAASAVLVIGAAIENACKRALLNATIGIEVGGAAALDERSMLACELLARVLSTEGATSSSTIISELQHRSFSMVQEVSHLVVATTFTATRRTGQGDRREASVELGEVTDEVATQLALCDLARRIVQQQQQQHHELHDRIVHWFYENLLILLDSDAGTVRSAAISSIVCHLRRARSHSPQTLASHLCSLWLSLTRSTSIDTTAAPMIDADRRRLTMLVCYHVLEFLLAELASSTGGVLASTSFWHLLREALLDDDSATRKYSAAILKQCVTHVLSHHSETSTAAAAVVIALPLQCWAQAQWDIFFLLYDSLDEFRLHLFRPQLERISTLFDTNTHSRQWLEVLYKRSFYHKNHAVRRTMLASFLASACAAELEAPLFRDHEFVIEHVLGAVALPGAHPTTLELFIASSSQEAAMQASEHDADDEHEDDEADADADEQPRGARPSSVTAQQQQQPSTHRQLAFFASIRAQLAACLASCVTRADKDGLLALAALERIAHVESPATLLFLVASVADAVEAVGSTTGLLARTVELLADLLRRDKVCQSPIRHSLQQQALRIVAHGTPAAPESEHWFMAWSRLCAAFSATFLLSQQQQQRMTSWLTRHWPQLSTTHLHAAMQQLALTTDAEALGSPQELLGSARRLARASLVVNDAEYRAQSFRSVPPSWPAVLLLHALTKVRVVARQRPIEAEYGCSPAQWSIEDVVSFIHTSLRTLIEAEDTLLEPQLPLLRLVIARATTLLQWLRPLVSAEQQSALCQWIYDAMCAYSASTERIDRDTAAIRAIALLGLWNSTPGARELIERSNDASAATTLVTALVRRTCRAGAGVHTRVSDAFHYAKWQALYALLASRTVVLEQPVLHAVFQHALGSLEVCTRSYIHLLLDSLNLLVHGDGINARRSSSPLSTPCDATEADKAALHGLHGLLAISVQDFGDMVFSAWRGFDDCHNRSISTLSSFVSLCLAPETLQLLARSKLAPELEHSAKAALVQLGELARRSLRVAVCLLEHLCTRVWAFDIAIAEWMMPEVVSFCLYATGTFDGDTSGGGGGTTAAASSASDDELGQIDGATDVQSWRSTVLEPRIILLSFLERLDLSIEANARFAERLLLELLRLNLHDAEFSQREFSTMTRTNRAKVNMWQTLCVLAGKPLGSSAAVHAVNSMVWEIVKLKNFGNVRYYIQLFAINVLLRHVELIDTELLARLAQVNADYQVATSINIIAAYVTLELRKRAEYDARSRELAQQLFFALLPWMNHYHHAVRITAQILVHKLLSSSNEAVLHQHTEQEGSLSQRFDKIYRFLDENKNLRQIRERQSYILDSFDPLESVSVALVSDSRRAHSLLDQVKRAIKHFQLQVNLPSPAAMAATPTSNSAKEARDDSDSTTDMQRRIQAWEMVAQESLELQMDRTEKIHARKRQSLIVVASLVDNVPNIAGLVWSAAVRSFHSW